MAARGARTAAAARWGVLRSLAMALRAALRPGAPSAGERLAALPRMVRATLRGEYAGLTLGRLLGMLGALVYVISPVDLVPEGLFTVIGLADDAMLVTWLAGALINDTEAFLAWERGVRGSHTASGPQDAPYAGAPGASAPAGAGVGGQPGATPQDGAHAAYAGAGGQTVRSHVVR